MSELIEIIDDQIDVSAIYVKDLYKRVYSCAVLFALSFVGGFFLSGIFIKYFLEVLNLKDVTVIVTSPFQIASLAVDFGMFLAFFITLPYIFFNLFAFMFPGLTTKEKRVLLLSVPGSLFLFTIGFVYGAAFFYYGMNTIASINIHLGIQNMWDISLFLSEIVMTSSLLGLLFQFPLVLIFLIQMGILNREALIEKRKIAIFTIFFLVSLLPPTDGLSLIVMSVPLVALYEITILFNNKKTYVWTRN